MSWHVTAKEIENWSSSNAREAQSLLPELIGKLILATVNPKNFHFPYGNSILTGGWDGMLSVDEGNPFVPEGNSVWEFGTNTSINAKAEQDYDKRTSASANKKLTYVFATTRTWAKKETFQIEKNKESKWKEVRGINTDDLEVWLLLAPAVHHWFAEIIGKRTINSFSIEQSFKSWSNQTEIPLSSELVLKSREDEMTKLENLLENEISIISISSSSFQESYAFILSCLKDNPVYSSRVLIITTQESWNNIVQSNYGLILIYKDFIPSNIGDAVSNGHFVVEALDADNIKDKRTNVILLNKIRKSIMISALNSMGTEDADKIYNDTKGFLYAIIRHELLVPRELFNPEWIDKYDINILSTILFANSWYRLDENDKSIIEELSGLSYAEFEKHLTLLKDEKYPPIRLVGNTWQVISKIELWYLIANRISINQIDKLKPIFIKIFSEIDPIWNNPSADKWFFNTDSLKFSGYIRKSIADTIALISAFGNSNMTYSTNLNIAINSWAKELFEKNFNVEAWYSYGYELVHIAEASPISFLDALEKTLEDKSTTKIQELFKDGGDFGGCFHCNLLWALESISWDTSLFSRSISILAKLSELDIKSSMGNNPLSTLENIFLGWSRNSNISLENKINVLRYTLMKDFPVVTWELLFNLLIGSITISSIINRPSYLDCNIDNVEIRTQNKIIQYNEDIITLILENIGTNEQRWNPIFDNINKFDENNYIKVINTFMAIDINSFTNDNRLLLSMIIRDKLYHHRKFNYKDSEDSKTFSTKLEEAFHYIEPDDILDKNIYLFVLGRPNILNPVPYKSDDKDAYKRDDKEILDLKKEVIKEIIEIDEFKLFVQLVQKIENYHEVGQLVYSLYGELYKENMLSLLLSDEQCILVCAKSYINCLPFEESLLHGLGDNQIVEVLMARDFNSELFEIIKKQKDNIQKQFWESTNANYFRIKYEDYMYVNWIIEQFIIYKQFEKAVDFIKYIFIIIRRSELELDNILLVKVLLEINNDSGKYDQDTICNIITHLQSSSIEIFKIKQLESKFINFYRTMPIVWEKDILKNPRNFVEMLSFIYSPKNKQDEQSEYTPEELQNISTTCRSIIDKISLFTKYDDIKEMNGERLKLWITEVRQGLKEIDRENMGEYFLGKLLASSPVGEDEIFPNEATREVLNDISTIDLDESFIIAKRNLRGMTTRVYDEGGNQERIISEKFKSDANNLLFTHPNVAKLLNELAKYYSRDGEHEDIRVELN
ncbi:MAG: hypothetical protein DRG78_00170 [Epsilonproteobacteria bacterium]|nr:MAG: hypothetical protein DRG78_00170 [Campylobacterota bacterium]